MDAQAIAFAATAAIIVVSPGPGAALIASTGLVHGRRAAMWVVLGLMSALLVFAALSVAGASRWLLSAPDLVMGMRYTGGAYLMWMGLRSIVGGLLKWGTVRAEGQRPADDLRAPSLVASGLFTALTNPSLLVLYLVVIPQFAPASLPPTSGAAVLAGIHIAIACIWNTLLALALSAMPRSLRGGSGAWGIAAGLCLLYLGAATAASP